MRMQAAGLHSLWADSMYSLLRCSRPAAGAVCTRNMVLASVLSAAHLKKGAVRY